MVKKQHSIGAQVFGNVVVYGAIGLVTIMAFGIFGVIFTVVALTVSLSKIHKPQYKAAKK